MKIGVITDTHFGYGWDTERENDSFVQAKEAFEKALDCDLILLVGDMFDRKIPTQEVWKEALKIFSIPLTQGKSNVKLAGRSFDRELSSLIFSGIPVVGIHGTHERRAKGFVNPIELLEKMGYLIHLHGEYVIFEKEKNGVIEKVAIHGMSGVPEVFAQEVLSKMDFKPIENCFNILLIHQSIEGYVYTEENKALKLEDLPDGFDYIIDGHIHWHQEGKAKNLVFPGSTLTTQFRKIESEVPKGFLNIDTEKKQIEFVKLESARELIYIEEKIESREDVEALRRKIGKELEKNFEKKPLFRLSVDLSEEISQNMIKRIIPENVISSVKIKAGNKRERVFQKFNDKRKSAVEEGLEFLEKQMKVQIRDFFNFLAENKIEDALKHLWEVVDDKTSKTEELEKSSRQQTFIQERS